MEPAAWVPQLLARQRQQTARTWSAIALRGVDESTPIVLDFHFTAPDPATADRLVTFLRAETPWEVATVSFNAGLMGRREWEVAGTTQRQPVNLKLLEEWVDWMVIIGADHGCRFGTWGMAAEA